MKKLLFILLAAVSCSRVGIRNLQLQLETANTGISKEKRLSTS